MRAAPTASTLRARHGQTGGSEGWGLTSARVPRSHGTHRTSSGRSGGLMGSGAADQRGDTLGWGLLSSACPHAAPYPSAARIPARSPSDGVTSVGMSDACQRAARQPCQLSLGWEKSNAAVRPSLRAFAIAPVAPRPSALTPQLSPCGAGRERLAWGLPGGALRGGSTGWPSEGVLRSCGICAERGGDRTGRMAAPSWEGVPEPAPGEGRERSPGAGGRWHTRGCVGLCALCSL